MAYKQADQTKGPGTSRTSMSHDPKGVSQDARQMRDMGTQNPNQTGGAGISASPSINIGSPDGTSPDQGTSVGSGSRPKKSMYPIGTSAPDNARTMGRVNGVDWLK